MATSPATTPATTPASAATATPSTTPPLFSASLISPEVSAALPPGYALRPLELGDYHRGFLDVLRVLTVVGDISEAAWAERYTWMAASQGAGGAGAGAGGGAGGDGGSYFILVIEETASRRCVAVGTLVVERKLYVWVFFFLPIIYIYHSLTHTLTYTK